VLYACLVGDKIPADMRLFKIMSTTLRIDQAILTGELFFVAYDMVVLGGFNILMCIKFPIHH